MPVFYEHQNGRTYKVDDRGERTQLANFIAEITHETRYLDGRTTETILTIVGKQEDTDLPPIEVTAEQFATLTWIMPGWGVQAIVNPGGGTKDDLRAAIQTFSKPHKTTIHRHIGWTTLNGRRNYLHGRGAINDKGADSTVRVDLPDELSRYCLPDPNLLPPDDFIRATLALTRIAPRHITWTLLAATLAPLYGPADFAIHLAGKTGTFKSELLSLYQSHYGCDMDARHLPGSWSSTANALEAQAYYAKNAVFSVDDFVPMGTAWQQRSYQTTADKIIRSQGNQSGRARLTDTSALQTAMYPRGLILSSGEDVPEGHSVRARMMILELSPGDITAQNLTAAQKQRTKYPHTTANLIMYLAGHDVDLKDAAENIRNQYLDVGHTRTPPMIGRLIATINHFLWWSTEIQAMTVDNAAAIATQAAEAILEAANKQQHYLQAQDPCEVFCNTIRHILTAHLGHVRTLNGGIPRNPTLLGWTEEATAGDIPTFRSHGPCIGWADWSTDAFYLDATAGYNTVKKHAGNELPTTKQTMMRRLKDDGLLTRVDDTRQRNTVRITAETHPRQVLMMPLSQTLDIQEKPE